MVDFLNDDITFQGEVTAESEFTVNGGLVVGPGGLHYGLPPSGLSNTWEAQQRIQVADETERDALVAWRNANAPISANRPLLVWRANGSKTGVNEMTTNGTDWYAESPMAGDIEMTLAAVAPYGWTLMKGQELNNAATNYPALWAVADPALRVGAKLKIPDMRGRVPMGVGKGSGLTMRNLGDLLGNEKETLTVANMPAHMHTGTTLGADRNLNHSHQIKFAHIAGNNISGSALNYETHDAVGGSIHNTTFVSSTLSDLTGTSLNHRHPVETDNTGGGGAHDNVQPSAVVNFKVKL